VAHGTLTTIGVGHRFLGACGCSLTRHAA
jgi:hypothetical protein